MAKKNYRKPLVLLGIIVALMALIRASGLSQYISLENAQLLKNWVNGYGVMGPLIYIIVYILSCVLFLPGLPITIVGALAFGPVKGAILSSTGAALGASAAFLIARYAARDMVEGWVQGNEQFKKIDEGVKNQGWRMIMITRLVPVFPFNLQNFAYGITNVGFGTYFLVSWICMIPAAIAYSFMAGSIVSGEGELGKTFIYLGIGAVFFVLLSLVPGWIKSRKSV